MSALRKITALVLLVGLLALVWVPATLAADATVTVTQHPTLGMILTDSEGKTLYRFTRDTINVSSACYNQCAVTWPPLLIDEGNPVAGEGVNGDLLGVLQRTDGKRQVMYNGMPLYYYNQDAKAGDINGQRVRDVWFIVHPNSTTVGYQPITVRMRKHDTLGTFLTDDQGRTLYLFTRDMPNVSVCYDRCATAWPPLLVDASTPQLAGGIGGSLGTIVRDDGNRQVTYEGKPLYYYTPDTTIGDTKGQGVGNVWYVVSPSAAPAAPAPAPAPAAPAPAPAAPAPATLPNTGAADSASGWLAALGLLLIVFSLALNGVHRKREM